MGGGDEVSYEDSKLRGRIGKVNPAGGRIRGTTGAINGSGRSAGRHNFFELRKKIVVKVQNLFRKYKVEQIHCIN